MGSACTSTTTSSAALPEWLTGPASETIQRSVTQSNRPYQAYTGELTAGINPTQQQGIDVVRGSQGNWSDQFGDAQRQLALATQTMGARDSGQRYIDKGVMTSSVDAASPLIAAGTGAGGLSTASPFLSAASATAPAALSAYMSPYTSSVVDEIGRLGSRNLTENILPNINDTFIGSGQFGSDRNAATIGRAIRDTSADIAGKQASALEAGYGQAGQLFTSDQNRLAQLASTAGGLGESAAGRNLTGAGIAGNLTNADANRWLQGGQAVAGMAETDRQAALAASRQAAALSGQQQTQNLTDANALLAAGGVQQQTQQRANDAALKQFTEGRDWNQNQLSWLNSIIRGTPAPQTTTTSAQSSPLSTVAGLASLFGSFFKDGGRVRPVQDYSPLTAAGRLHLQRGGYIEDDEEEDPLLPEEDDSTDGDGGPGLPAMAPQLAAATSPLAASATPLSALSILRDRALKGGSDPDLKAALASVDEAQKSALEPRKREKSWMDSPLALAGLSILAAPPGTSGISAIGQGALAAVKTRQAERRLDQTEDQARRMDALKVAQQRLSNILSARTADTRTLGTLATVEGAAQRAKDAADARVEAAKAAAEARIEAAREAGASRTQIAQMMAESRADVARILAESRQGVAQTTADSRRDVAGMTNETRQLIQKARSGDVAAALEVKNRGLDLNAEARRLDRESRDRIAEGRLVPKEVRLADALGFDLETEDGRQQFADFSVKTKPMKGYAPLQIEKAQKIIDDPNAAPELKTAARNLLSNSNNRDMTPAQLANLRARAATLANADFERYAKDYQFNSPEDQAAYKDRLVEFHRQQLIDGATGDAPPVPGKGAPAAAPAAAVAPPPPGAPVAAPAPASSPLPPAGSMRPRLGTGEEKDLRGVVGTVTPLLSDIDSITARLEKETPSNWVTGIGGAAQRAYNATAGQVFGNASKEDSELFAKLNSLKPRLQSLLKVDSNMSKDERKDLESLLDNTAAFVSRDTALANLKEARRILASRQAVASERLGGRATPGGEGGGPQPKTSAKERAAAVMASGKRPPGFGPGWVLGLNKPSGLLVWRSPDGKQIPAE